MRAKDHPNNAPGVPMVFPPWFENLQVKYLNRMVRPFARVHAGIRDHQTSRPDVR